MAARNLGSLTLNVTAEVGGFERGMDKVERSAAKAAQQVAREQSALDKANKSFIDGLKDQSDAIGKTRVQILEMQAAQKGLTAQAAPYIAKLKEQEAALQRAARLSISTASLPSKPPPLCVVFLRRSLTFLCPCKADKHR